MRSVHLLPRIALIDPELTTSLPPLITATTGLDALTQLIEPYTCHTPTPITDSLCIDGLKRISTSLIQAYDHGEDIGARESMALSSLYGGLALANARLGAVHGLAAPIGGLISAPHGAVCACLLPYVMETNLQAMKERAPAHPSLQRYEVIGKILIHDDKATAVDAIQWIRKFCDYVKIPSLAAYGLTESEFSVITKNALNASSMKGNPIPLFEDELRNILYKAI